MVAGAGSLQPVPGRGCYGPADRQRPSAEGRELQGNDDIHIAVHNVHYHMTVKIFSFPNVNSVFKFYGKTLKPVGLKKTN